MESCPELEAIKIEQLQSGDIIILKFKGVVSERLAKRLQEHFRENIPDGAKVIVMGNGECFDIEVRRSKSGSEMKF